MPRHSLPRVRLLDQLLVMLVSSACADDTETCDDDSDCSESKTCVSWDDDPNDNVLVAQVCAKICTANGDCGSVCCDDNLCAPGWCCE